jgi:hypothetical protein
MNTYQPKSLDFWKRFSPTSVRTCEDHQTPRQSAMIRALGHSQNISIDRACQHLFKCNSADDLNRSASSTLIEWLKCQPKQNHVSDALVFNSSNQLEAR